MGTWTKLCILFSPPVRSRDTLHVNQPTSITINALHPHHHLYNVSRHSYNSWNTPTTTPHHRDTPSTQTDYNGSKMHQTRLETEQRVQGRVGEHAKDKRGGVQGMPTIFSFLLHNFTNLCFPYRIPLRRTPKHARSGMFWCSVASPTFWASATYLFHHTQWTCRFRCVRRVFLCSL